MVIETLGFLMVIALGLPAFGKVNYLEMPLGLQGIFQAPALIFFVFIGFEEMVRDLRGDQGAGEKYPNHGAGPGPRCSHNPVHAGGGNSVSVLGRQALSQSSSAPFADIAYTAFGEEAFVLLGIIALFATSNTAPLLLLAASTISLGMAEEGSLPRGGVFIIRSS